MHHRAFAQELFTFLSTGQSLRTNAAPPPPVVRTLNVASQG